jgi:hypothetical protein
MYSSAIRGPSPPKWSREERGGRREEKREENTIWTTIAFMG